MKKIAIIGTGIAGMACAYYLHRDYALTLFEKNDAVGGHTNTVMVREKDQEIPIDTGFMVYNEKNYPRLTQLFRELKVESQDTSMSFGVQHCPYGLVYGSGSLGQLFAQRKNVLSPSYWRMLYDILRFFRSSKKVLEEEYYQSMSLGKYIEQCKYGRYFCDCYLIPMCSAIWSTPAEKVLDFPLITLLRFFKNHGLLDFQGQLQWKTPKGGSRVYRDKIFDCIQAQVFCQRPAKKIYCKDGYVTVMDASGKSDVFDHVIVAAHADQALKLLDQPNALQKRLLKPFSYTKNTITLHTDSKVMPFNRKAWASWNYRVEGETKNRCAPSTIYWMNRLQGVSRHIDYFVSVNDTGMIDPRQIIKEIEYEHPVFDFGAIRAQSDLHKLNENGFIYFCGSYFRHGFHEDALASAIAVCRAINEAQVFLKNQRRHKTKGKRPNLTLL